MPSFDIVSRTELPEVDNAVQGAVREIGTRYDFKGSNCSIERADTVLTIKADDDFKLKQVQELLRGHLARRKVDAGASISPSPRRRPATPCARPSRSSRASIATSRSRS